jgi:ribulose-phosphate 3-epimerase
MGERLASTTRRTVDLNRIVRRMSRTPIRLAPSFLPAADFARLAEETARIAPAIDLLHIDVMDGHFVPNLTVGPPVIKSLRKHTDLYFDCHLMIEQPGKYLDAFKDAGANSLSVHIEVGETAALLRQIREMGLDVGLGINPATPFEQFAEFLDQIDMLLIMTVVPGFGGQKFMQDVMPKVREAREEITRRGLDVSIEVDGGVNLETAPIAAENGADTFVLGNSSFGADDPAAAAAQIREAIDAVRRN